MNIHGAVLAGGKSSRYGRQKMFEAYHGLPLYQYSVQALKQGGADSIYIVTNRKLAPRFAENEGEILLEDTPYQGPLPALALALKQLQKDSWVFLLAADIPFISAEFVKKLIENADSGEIDAVIPVSGGRVHPLHGLYHQCCLSSALMLIGEGKAGMYPLLQKVRTSYVPFPDEQKDFININRPEDWPPAEKEQEE
ncbi:molybdenum cofactor guanylyltransferase [Alteribacillus sp. HJP-4]|uniref:molybdenum cofactor guanylyltransferase n=1 Tax=Alteribacillus sp. HJP-4 TaxID=2775394 RepID=UPI0035CCEB3A